jgi:hypothetical protein
MAYLCHLRPTNAMMLRTRTVEPGTLGLLRHFERGTTAGLTYPRILQFLTAKSQLTDNQFILQLSKHASEQIQIVQSATGKSSGIVPNDIHQLLNRLTYTRFVELMRCEVTSAAAVAGRPTEGRFLAAEGVISRMEGKISPVFMRHLPASPKLGC